MKWNGVSQFGPLGPGDFTGTIGYATIARDETFCPDNLSQRPKSLQLCLLIRFSNGGAVSIRFDLGLDGLIDIA
jgi:hypothetical protein